jgi:hypothetical protein
MRHTSPRADRRRGRRTLLSLLCIPTLAAAGLVAPPAVAAAPVPWHVWRGEPAMISDAHVYRAKEFIWQDYLYDDHGPNTDGIDHTDAPFGAGPNPHDPTNPKVGSSGGIVRYAGDFMYPAPDGRHYDNVADLIEFRVARDGDHVFYLFRLGALVRRDSTVIGMCVNEDRSTATGLHSWPFGANVNARLGCDHHYTIHGTGTKVTDAQGRTRELSTLGGATRVDLTRNVIEVRVPTSVADPRTPYRRAWRFHVGAGLWDAANQRWVQPAPGPQQLGAPVPNGGGDGTAPNIFDLLSNHDEPNTYWREERQANDLKAHDLLPHYIDVGFTRLQDGRNDPDPRRAGVVDRIYVSKYPFRPRADGSEPEGIDIAVNPTHDFVYYGRYQPYAMVIPRDYWQQRAAYPSRRWAFDQCLHPLHGNHHVEIYYAEAQARAGYNPLVTQTTPSTGYLGFSVYERLYTRLNKIYACGLGRGEAVGYTGGDGMVDAFEVMADVKRRYPVDVDQQTLHGISLGAIGTWYIAQRYPDLYAAAMPYIFTPGFGSDFPLFANLLNLPVFYVIGQGDQFGQAAFGDAVADEMERLGNEYLYYHHLIREHELSLGDEALPFSEPLFSTRRRVANPPRVRFILEPEGYNAKLGVRNGAYWVSGMRIRPGQERGSVDVTSLARADQLPAKQVIFRGVYSNTEYGHQTEFRGLFRMSRERFLQLWRPEAFEPGWKQLTLDVRETALPRPPVSNAFRLHADALQAVTLDATRMRLDTRRAITATVSGDGSVRLTLLGRFPSRLRATLDGASVPVTTGNGALSLTLPLRSTAARLVITPLT